MSAGSASNSNFENAFADAAYADVKTKAPGLVNYMVGFQVLDVNEDETRAAAVFGFKVNSSWIFVPAFFVNGRIRGMDMMYLRGNDLFVPLRDDWVSHILSKGPDVLGSTEERERSELNLRSPDYAYSMRGGGLAKTSASDEFRKAAAEFGREYLGEAASLDPEKVWKRLADLPGKLMDVRPFAAKSAAFGSALYSELNRLPDLKTAAGWLYDLRTFPKEASARIRPWGGTLRERLGIRERMAKAAAAKFRGTGVVRVTQKNAALFRPFLNEAKIASLFAGGEAVLDFRKGAEDLVVRVRDEDSLLTTPRETGDYTLVSADGTEHDAHVFLNPKVPAYGSTTGTAVVYFRDLKAGGLFASEALAARRTTETPGKDPGLPLTGVKHMKQYRMYALVFPDGSCSVPFQPTLRNVTDNGETWVIQVEDSVRQSDGACGGMAAGISARGSEDPGPSVRAYSTDPGRTGIGKWISSPNRATACKPDDKPPEYEFTHNGEKMYVHGYEAYGRPWHLIVRDDAEPGVMSVTPAGVVVSGDAKALELGDKALINDGGDAFPVFGGSTDIDRCLDGAEDRADITTITVSRDAGAEVEVQGVTGDIVYRGVKESGVVPLMESLGVSEKSAREILDSRGRVYVKGGARIGDKLSVPWPSDDRAGGSDEFGWPTQVASQKSDQDVGQLLPDAGDTSAYDILRDEEVNKMIGAAREGKKDVFDVSMVSGLVKSVDTSEQIDEFIPDLLRGMDRVGRIRFLLYWHLDDFEERYGRQDVAELDDSLKTVFKSMGDLILFLHGKTLDEQPEMRSMDMSLADIS